MIIAFDVDGVMRNIDEQILQYMEEDYPDKVEQFKEERKTEHMALSATIGIESTIKWLYENRPFEIFAIAPRTHRTVIEDLNKFARCAEDQGHTVVIASVQRGKGIMATLSWLSKFGCKVKHYDFFDSGIEKLEARYDVYIEDNPDLLSNCGANNIDVTSEVWEISTEPFGIKVPHGYNESVECPVLDIAGGHFDDLYDILNIERGL